MQTCRVLLPNDAEADDRWTDALACRAGRLCQQSEAQTLMGVQMTWGELRIHDQGKGVEAVSLDAAALEDFVYKNHAQTCASIASRGMEKIMPHPATLGIIWKPADSARMARRDSAEFLGSRPHIAAVCSLPTATALCIGTPFAALLAAIHIVHAL